MKCLMKYNNQQLFGLDLYFGTLYPNGICYAAPPRGYECADKLKFQNLERKN